MCSKQRRLQKNRLERHLSGTFELSFDANVGPRTISAFLVLERSSKMASKSKMAPRNENILFFLPNGQRSSNFENLFFVLFVLLGNH
jgi:hypothetical protein